MEKDIFIIAQNWYNRKFAALGLGLLENPGMPGHK